MSAERLLPEQPLEFIRRCVRERKLLWTYHVNMRLSGRFISRKTILGAVASVEIIEAYPQDKYLPSYLVYAQDRAEVIHVLFAVDVAGDNVRVVTAYRPNPSEWELDLRTRRRP
jgi:hypothetical protein